MATSITSEVTILQSLTKPSYSVTWAGTNPSGTLEVQASDDYALSANGQTVANAGTWNTMPLVLNGVSVTSIPISGNTGNGMIDIESLSAYAVRLVYTPGDAPGTGVMSAIINAKVA
jgi:hypothetical protein